MISRRQYNDRRKLLFEKTERVQKLMSERLNRHVDVFAIDSMPIEICKLSREKGNKIKWVKNLFTIHQIKDIVPSQKKYFYGYKLQQCLFCCRCY